MKKLFFAAIALVAMVGCDNNFNEIQNVPNGGDAALLKVNIKAAGDLTRAGEPGDYKDGTDAENAVERVDFYFFDANGGAYAVDGAANGENFISYKPNFVAETETNNIEEISDVVLVIKGSKKQLPTQMIAVVNDPAAAATKSKAQLEAAVLNTLRDEAGNFVMSNSVYMDGTVKITATQILPENIFTTTLEEDVDVPSSIELEGVNPVDIYVERVAAAVEVNIAEGNKYDTGVTYGENGGKIYAKVLGWGVTNNTAEGNLIKSINASYEGLGFTWNNAPFFRSYWANTTAQPAHNLTFNALMAHKNEVDYYFENTLPAAAENSVVAGEGNQTPQLLVAAQLVDEAGEPIQLGQWFGVQYTIEDLKTVMINTVVSKLFVANGENTYISVDKDDVVFYQMPETTADNRYEVKVTVKEGVNYFDAEGKALTADAAHAILDAISPAKMYTTGYTYYYTNINHYGATTGIVRNHWYEINLKAITGLGTPVYNPEHVITPEKPEEEEPAHLAAQINVLSWSLVQNDVTLN